MLASVCTSLFSLDGVFMLELSDKSDTDNIKRRVARTATLDGGAVTVDLGYSDSDRAFILSTADTQTAIEIREKARTHSQFTLSIKAGVFLCSFERCTFATGEASIYFLAV